VCKKNNFVVLFQCSYAKNEWLYYKPLAQSHQTFPWRVQTVLLVCQGPCKLQAYNSPMPVFKALKTTGYESQHRLLVCDEDWTSTLKFSGVDE